MNMVVLMAFIMGIVFTVFARMGITADTAADRALGLLVSFVYFAGLLLIATSP